MKRISIVILIACLGMTFVPEVKAQFQYLLASSEVSQLKREFDKKTQEMEKRIGELEKRLAVLEKRK